MLVGIAGFATSGKTSAANVLVEEFGFRKISFADPLREAALALDPLIEIVGWNEFWRLSVVIKEFGWTEAKRLFPDVRDVLVKLGTEVGRTYFGESCWNNVMASTYPDMARKDTRYVIDDLRFENEVQFVRMGLGEIIWVDRPGLAAGEHVSESGAPKRSADYIIDNSEDLEYLRLQVRDFAVDAGWFLN